MKKLFVIFLFITVGFSAKSQFGYAHFNYYAAGGKLGFDQFYYPFDKGQQISLKSQTNISIGGAAAYYATWLFEFHGEAYYSNRSFTLKWDFPQDPDGVVKSETYHRISYLSFPMQAGINALYFDYFKLNIRAGIMPELRFRPYEEIIYQNGNVSVSKRDWSTKKFSLLGFALPVTAEFKFLTSKHNSLVLTTSYIYYLSKIHKTYLTSPASTLSFRVGYYYEW